MNYLQKLFDNIKSDFLNRCHHASHLLAVKITLRTLSCYLSRRGSTAAGSLALTTIIALVPACIIAFSIIAHLPGVTNYQQEIVSAALDQFVPENSETVKLYLTIFIEDSSSLSWLQLSLLVVSTLLLIHSVNQSINQMFETHHQRHGIAVFGVYLAILIFGPTFLGFSFALSIQMAELPIISSVIGLFGDFAPVSVWLPFFVAWLSLFVMYYFVPSERVKPLVALVGALVAAVLIEINKLGFGLYVSSVDTYQVLYGTMSAIPLFLIWVYLTWSIILFGAALTSCIEDKA